MNERIKAFVHQAWDDQSNELDAEFFAELIIEETLEQVDERTCDRGNTQWYGDDKKWVRLHFGYGTLAEAQRKAGV